MNQKVLLCMTGQVERTKRESFNEVIEYHQSYIQFDHLLCHLWESEYEKYVNGTSYNNVTFKFDKDSYPFDPNYENYISSDDLNFHKESLTITNGKALPWGEQSDENRIRMTMGCCKMSTGLTECFRKANELDDYNIFIRSRYDLIYRKKLDINKLLPYLNTQKPVIFIPKTGYNYGLVDTFWVMNKSGLKLFTNYLEDTINYSKEYRIFFPEPLLRFHLNNIKKCIVYRFNFPNTLEHWLKQHDHVPDFKTDSITIDIRKFKHGEHKDFHYVI